MKNNNIHISQLKGQIQNITINLESIENGRDISGSMVKLNKTLNKVKPLLSKQTEYIRNFLNSQGHTDPASKQAQARRFVNRIYEISNQQFAQMIQVAQKYLTLDIKKNWNKVKNQIEKDLQLLRQKADQGKTIQFLFAIMNAKDRMFQQFLKSMLYQKILLFQDLNIGDNGYVHSQKKATKELIQSYIVEKDYAPTHPFYEQINFEKRGFWGMHKIDQTQTTTTQLLKILDTQYGQLYEVIRNFSHLNQQQRQHSDIKRNQPVIISLREKIQKMNRNYEILEKKYRDAIGKDQKMDIVEMKQKLKSYEDQLQLKQGELKQLKFQFRDSSNQINSLRQKVKSLQDDLEKLTNQEMVKLKQVQLIQSNLMDEFSRIIKNMANFGKMFEFQSDGKRSLAKEIINQKNTIQKMAEMLGLQKRINNDLKTQIVRLNEIIFELAKKIENDQ